MVYDTNDDLALWAEEVVSRYDLREAAEVVLLKYGGNVINSSRRDDASMLWIYYCKEGALCEKRIMQSGVSGIKPVKGNR